MSEGIDSALSESVDSGVPEIIDSGIPVDSGASASVESGVSASIDSGVVESVDSGIAVDSGASASVDSGVPESIEPGDVESVESGILMSAESGVSEGVDPDVSEGVDSGVTESDDSGVVESVESVVPGSIDTGISEIVGSGVLESVELCVQLIEDLLLLKVVSVGFSRLHELLHPEEYAELDYDLDVLERRAGPLKTLFEKLKSSQASSLQGVESIALTSTISESKVPYVSASELLQDPPIDDSQNDEAPRDEESSYLRDNLVYNYALDSEGVLESKDPSEDEMQEVYPISTTFFNELFPTVEPTKKKYLPGSFPDIGDFTGGIKFVGKGFYGLVFKSILHGVPVVLKVSKRKSEEANRDDYHEWSVSERLNAHPNVLRVIGLCPSFQHPHFKNAGTTAIISPWQENQGLRTFYDKRSPKDDDLQNIAFGMIQGIRSLHEQGVVHRDIAVRNFLVDNDGRVLLCDFGLTEFLPKGKRTLQISAAQNKLLPWRYLAPESFSGTFSAKSDIWMYGLALAELITKKEPWHSIRSPQALRASLMANAFELPDIGECPPIVAGIIRDCCQHDAAARPTADDISERLARSQFAEDEESRDERGDTRIHRMAREDEWDLLKKTLDLQKPVMVNAVNYDGDTPLMLSRFISPVEKFLSYRKVPSVNMEPSRSSEYFHNIDVYGTLQRLAEKEDVEYIRSFGRICKDVDVPLLQLNNTRRGDSPLHIAAKTGNVELVDALMSLRLLSREKVNEEGRTALHVAALSGYTSIIEKLLAVDDANEEDPVASKSNADHSWLNIQDNAGKTALHLAAASGSVSATRTLINDSATKLNVRDAEERSPIFESLSDQNGIEVNQVGVLQVFVDLAGVDINVKDSNDETIVHKVARRGLVQAAMLLFERTDLKVFEHEREHKYNPLQLAVRQHNFAVAEVLLARGDAAVDELDKHGNTILHLLAAANGHPNRETEEASIPLDLKYIKSEASSPLNLKYIKSMEGFTRKLFSQNSVKVNAQNSRGNTPLHVAMTTNNRFIVETLLSRSDVDVNAVNKKGETPLYLASYHNYLEVVELIISRSDVDVNAHGEYSRTPLHYAALRNEVEHLKLLLSRNDLDVNARDKSKRTPLHLAVQQNSVECATLLLSRGDIDVDARDVNDDGPIHLAAEKNSVECLNLLLSRADAIANSRSSTGYTPLHKAAQHESVECLNILLSRDDVDVNARSIVARTPLHQAADFRSVECVKILLSRNDVELNARTTNNETPLHLAAGKNSVECLKLLLSRDDVIADSRTIFGYTPLHYAAERKSADCLQTLLSRHDVDANARSIISATPLHHAAYNNSVECLRILLTRNDVDVNARTTGDNVDSKDRTTENYTPLHMACMAVERNNAECVKILLSRNDVEVNARTTKNETPLHLAVSSRKLYPADFSSNMPNTVECVKLLLLRDDVVVEARDHEGLTALDRAKKNNATACIELLQNAASVPPSS